MKFSEEKRIDQKKFRFIPRKVADPINKEKVRKQIDFLPETFKRIHKLACQDGISFSKALERMLDTEEAKAMTPDVTTTWMDKVKAEVGSYASYNLFQKTRKTNGNTKGISRKV
jgi:hypothetical protein